MARAAKNICRSPAALEDRDSPVVEDSYIIKPQPSNPRKRPYTKESRLPTSPSSKQQKRKHSFSNTEPPNFWDSLSKVWLTKRALEESNRRNAPPESSEFHAHRPTTRAFKAERKKIRQRISAAEFCNHSSSRRLKDIQNFARGGGPDLSDIVGYQESTHSLSESTMSSSRSNPHQKENPSSTSKARSATEAATEEDESGQTTPETGSGQTEKSNRSSPYDANFRQNLNDNGVLQHGYRDQDDERPPFPCDWEESTRRIDQDRGSLSPSAFQVELYEAFMGEDDEAHNEEAVKDSVLPAMLKAMGVDSKDAPRNTWFDNLDPIACNITQAQPDYYYGAQPEELDLKIRKKLSKRIIPSSSTDLPIVPNFFLEAKGPTGSPAVAIRQACHYGTIGARAVNSLQTYGQDHVMYEDKISAISTIYQRGLLKIFGHSVAHNGPDKRPEYHMHRMRSYNMIKTAERFRKGTRAFKNAIDLAKEYRNAAIAHANGIAARITQTHKENDEDDEDHDSGDGDKEAGESSAAHSFTNPIVSTLIETEDSNEGGNQGGSDTSVEGEYQRYPPTIRSSQESLQPPRPQITQESHI